MLGHYMKVAVRQLLKYKFHTVVSVLCMGIGLTFNGYMNLFFETSIEPENKCNIYLNGRLSHASEFFQLKDSGVEGLENIVGVTLRPISANAYVESKPELPFQVGVHGISDIFFRYSDGVMQYGSYWIREGRDSIGRDEAIISKGLAKKIFDTESAIGKSITLAADSLNKAVNYEGNFEGHEYFSTTYRIVGVLDMGNDVTSWMYVPLVQNNTAVHVSADLVDGYSVKEAQENLNAVQWRAAADGEPLSFYLLAQERDMTFWLVLVVVKLFSWLIFIIGFVNFMKFMVQMFYTRQREIALRKCMGSDSKGLYALLASEVVLVLLLSFLVSCIVSELSLSYVKYMNLDFNMYVDFRLLFMLQLKATVIALAVGLVAVLFPVLRLRRVEMKGAMVRRRQGKKTRNIMFALQFAITIVFLCLLGFVVLGNKVDKGWLPRQLSGAERERIIAISRYTNFWDEIHPQIANLPDIELVASAHSCTILSDVQMYVTVAVGSDTVYSRLLAMGDPNFFEMFNINVNGKLVKSSDRGYMYVDKVLHERLMQNGNFDGTVSRDLWKYQVAGVMEDELFPFTSETFVSGEGLIPLCGFVFSVEEAAHTDFFYRVRKGASVEDVKKSIETIIRKYVPESFEVKVNTIGELHRMVHQPITSLLHLAYLLVFICMLVLVLSVYSSISLDAATRQKDIAVRKINGARKKDILRHFILPYVTTYLVTFIIVYPLLCCLMYWATQGGAKMQRSLMEYYCPYGVFILVVTLGLLLLTTWHKIKLIMKVNPADVIRRE